MAVTVEFVGPNGVGKRSVIQVMTSILTGKATSVDLLREAPRLTRVQEIANNFVLWVQLTRERECRQLNSLIWRDAELRRFESAEGLVLVDEGPRHGLLGAAAAGRVEGFSRVHRAFQKPDRLVSLTADVDELSVRLRQKPSSHWVHRLGGEELNERLLRYARFQNMLVHETSVPTISLDTSQLSPSQAAYSVSAELALCNPPGESHG